MLLLGTRKCSTPEGIPVITALQASTADMQSRLEALEAAEA
jgi:hypothetical protein